MLPSMVEVAERFKQNENNKNKTKESSLTFTFLSASPLPLAFCWRSRGALQLDLLHFLYKLRYAGTRAANHRENIFHFKAANLPIFVQTSLRWHTHAANLPSGRFSAISPSPPRHGFALVPLASCFIIPLNDLIGKHTRAPTLNTRAGAGAGCISALAGACVSVC
jgi:hypothetical protein